MFMPAHILFQHLAGLGSKPMATSDFQRAGRLMTSPIVRTYLFALTSLSFFHWAHRFRYYLLDFGVTGSRRLIAAVCYGSAIAATLGALRTLMRLPDKDR